MNKIMKFAVVALLALGVAVCGTQAQLTSVTAAASSITSTGATLKYVMLSTNSGNGVIFTNTLVYSNIQDFGPTAYLWRNKTNIAGTFGTNSVVVVFPSQSLGETWYYRVSSVDSQQSTAVWATNGVTTFVTPVTPFNTVTPQASVSLYYAPTNAGNQLYFPLPTAGSRLYLSVQQPSNNSYAQVWPSTAVFPVGITATNLFGTNCTFYFEFYGSISNSSWYNVNSSVVTNRP